MRLNKSSSAGAGKDSVKTSGCGCGTKHSATGGFEVEETEIEVSK